MPPTTKYFTNQVWPAYKNYTSAAAPADNACYQIQTGTPPTQYTLDVTIVGDGIVDQAPDKALYNEDETVNLTAYAAPGWEFSGWSEDLTGSANPETIVMDSDKYVTATFVEKPLLYSLTVNITGNGSVTVDPLKALYYQDEPVTLTANPDSGWLFSGWSGDLSGSTNPEALVMDENKTVMATFVEAGGPMPGDVIISAYQAWNSPDGQNPGEFIELFNTTDNPISLENMDLITWLDQGDGDGSVDLEWQLSATTADLTGKFIAPHSFFLVAESGVAAPSDLHDVEVDMDLATGEAGFEERAISVELTIDGTHMDYFLYGRDDGSSPSGELPQGDLPFDGSSWPRSEVVRNTQNDASFREGLIFRETQEDLFAGYAVEGYYTDEDALGDGYPNGVWTSPHDETFGDYEARNSLSPAVEPPTPEAFAFVVSSDWHTSSDSSDHLGDNLPQIKTWIDNPTTEMPAPEFLVIVGDFPHYYQTQAKIDTYLGTGFLWYPVIGNHEVSDDINNFYAVRDTIVPSLPHIDDYGPAGSVNTSYSWSFNNAHFVSINAYWDGTTNTNADHSADGDIKEPCATGLAPISRPMAIRITSCSYTNPLTPMSGMSVTRWTNIPPTGTLLSA